MELILDRAYYKEGTHGTLFCSDRFLCYTIELPWRKNKRMISCIPEDRYEIVSRFSKRLKNHLWIKGVYNRRLILLHPANNALKELEGCIAPVSYLSGLGKGIYSKDAMQKLLSLVHQAQDRNEPIYLTIKSQNHEHCRTL